jgi:hypothetical protein
VNRTWPRLEEPPVSSFGLLSQGKFDPVDTQYEYYWTPLLRLPYDVIQDEPEGLAFLSRRDCTPDPSPGPYPPLEALPEIRSILVRILIDEMVTLACCKAHVLFQRV